MTDWKQCEGELVGREFPLDRYLGGSDNRAVFLTRVVSGSAAIKLVRAGAEQAAELVERWKRAGALSHPHLVRIFATGTCDLAVMPLAYLVMEYAEENLAEVLRERALTRHEAREMLQPVADALAYLHEQGLVHGNLKPSNILALDDTVKITSETVSAGDPAEDIHALGVMLLQALTGEATTVAPGGPDLVPDSLPFPFRAIVQNCLHHDPRLRCSAVQIADWLRSPERAAWIAPSPTAPAAKSAAEKPRTRFYVAAVTLAVGAAIFGGVVMNRKTAPAPASPPAPSPTVPSPAPRAALPSPPAKTSAPAKKDEITRRVLPEIPAQARNTIHGKVTVVVKVAVDPSGGVTKATLERSGSAYFGKLAVEAARHWQFSRAEGEGPRYWTLRFEISRTATQAAALRAARE